MEIIGSASVGPLPRATPPSKRSVAADVAEIAAETQTNLEMPRHGLCSPSPRLVTMTPLTRFQRRALTTFIYRTARGTLSPDLLSDTKPPSDQDVLTLALVTAARVEMSDFDAIEFFCVVLGISDTDFLEATKRIRARGVFWRAGKTDDLSTAHTGQRSAGVMQK